MAKRTTPRPHMTQAECDRLKRLREAGHSYAWIEQVMRRTECTLRRAVRNGYKAVNPLKRPVPPGFALDAKSMTANALKKKYAAGMSTVLNWLKEVDPNRPAYVPIKGLTPPNRTYPPEGFLEFYRTHGYRATQRHYNIPGSKVSRWLADCGVLVGKRAKKPEPVAPANDITAPPPGYDQFKRKLGSVPSLYEVAA